MCIKGYRENLRYYVNPYINPVGGDTPMGVGRGLTCIICSHSYLALSGKVVGERERDRISPI